MAALPQRRPAGLRRRRDRRGSRGGRLGRGVRGERRRLAAIAGLDAPRDVTVEAWVNPGPGDTTARRVQHRSDASSYLLALREVPSALTFDGTSQYFTVSGGTA